MCVFAKTIFDMIKSKIERNSKAVRQIRYSVIHIFVI